MSGMSRLHKPNPNRKQLLFFTQDELKENYFAVVRITWFAADRICAVKETVVYEDDLIAIAEVEGMVRGALRSGADVSIVCIAEAADIGLEPS